MSKQLGPRVAMMVGKLEPARQSKVTKMAAKIDAQVAANKHAPARQAKIGAKIEAKVGVNRIDPAHQKLTQQIQQQHHDNRSQVSDHFANVAAAHSHIVGQMFNHTPPSQTHASGYALYKHQNNTYFILPRGTHPTKYLQEIEPVIAREYGYGPLKNLSVLQNFHAAQKMFNAAIHNTFGAANAAHNATIHNAFGAANVTQNAAQHVINAAHNTHTPLNAEEEIEKVRNIQNTTLKLKKIKTD